MATNSPTPTYVQVRLDPAIAAQLREAGEAQGRKLPAEIVQRLTASLAPKPGDRVGGVIGALLNRISTVTGVTEEGDLFELLRSALPVLLDGLEARGAPASPIMTDKMAKGLAVAVARNLAREVKADPARASEGGPGAAPATTL